jgi:DNA-binding beta-propeller fold protein YncE
LSTRKRLALVVRLLAASSVIGAMIVVLMSGGGCRPGLYPLVTPTGSVTATPTSANAYLYATNTTDGTISAFTRNTATGALGFIAQQSAGAANGPVGLAVTPLNEYIYVANSADGNVYEYSINQTGTLGNLTSLGEIVSGSVPQLVAVDYTSSFVYVTNAGSQSVSEYSINSGGTLTLVDTLTGFTGTPFGILAHPSTNLLYVADNTAGVIYVFSILSNGELSEVGSPVYSNGTTPGQPGEMAIAIDSTAEYLFVDDTSIGVVSVFVIQSDGSLAYSGSFGTGQSRPIGIGAVNDGGDSGNTYVLTANMDGNFVQPFLRSAATLTQQASVSDKTGPTGLVIDPEGLFAYTGNSGNGTIGLIGIENSQCSGSGTCLIGSFASESPAKSSAGTQFVATTH